MPSTTAAGDVRTPLSTVKRFLSGVKTKDTASMRGVLSPGAGASLIGRGEEPVHTSLEQILSRVASTGHELEELSSDEIELVDDDYATVWAPYRFFQDGELHHAGTSTFSLWRHPERGWVIVDLVNVARKGPGVESALALGRA